MNTPIKDICKKINENGYVKIEGFLPPDEIDKAKTSIVKPFQKWYSKEHVKHRLYYQREESGNRIGDAVMVSLEVNSLLPSFVLQKTSLEARLLKFYNTVVGELTGVNVKDDSRSMLNIQQYFDKSFEVVDHYDGEFFEFEHALAEGDDEMHLKVKSGLIPRFVMVMVLENENDGRGTYVRMHDSDERIYVDANAGDAIIFDNLKMRHGVPPLEKPRLMIGFRNFDHMPYQFSSTEIEGSTPLHDNKNPGFVREISSQSAKEMMYDFNIIWEDELFEKQMKKSPAF